MGAEVNTKIEKKDLTDEQKRKEKESKYDDSHLEKSEKKVELSKQKVARWIAEDEENEKKLIKMRSWEKEKKKGSQDSVAEEAKAKKHIVDITAAFERADKKKVEIREKEGMSAKFSELIRKDDEKLKQEAE